MEHYSTHQYMVYQLMPFPEVAPHAGKWAEAGEQGYKSPETWFGKKGIFIRGWGSCWGQGLWE